MIEINLIPDVKQEFIRAQRVRTAVISIAIIVTIIAAGVVVLLALYVFGGQQLRQLTADNKIEKQNKTLQDVSDINNVLTIQNQLSKLSEMHNNKHIDSRMLDVLASIVPQAPNEVAVSKIAVDSAEGTITIDAQANNGYPALEVFRKTIEATKFEYVDGEQTTSVPLATDIKDSNRSYGENDSGKKVLRFSVTFTYPQELFDRNSTSATIVGPTRRNVTDSFVGVPESLFTERAADTKEGDQ